MEFLELHEGLESGQDQAVVDSYGDASKVYRAISEAGFNCFDGGDPQENLDLNKDSLEGEGTV